MKPALDINTILNTNVDNNSNKVIEKKELEYITNNKDTTIQSSITYNNIKYEQSKTNTNTNSMVSSFDTSSINNIVPQSLKKYRKKEVINKLEKGKKIK